MVSERLSRVAFSPMNAIAAVSALVLFGAIAWTSLERYSGTAPAFVRTATAPADGIPAEGASLGLGTSTDATSTTPLGDAVLGQFASRFVALSQNGLATDTAAITAADITPTVQAQTFAPANIPTDPDTSLAGVIRYRNDLRIALAPLLNNTSPELDIYARWIDTGDDQYLNQLRSIAHDYASALSAAQKVHTPTDGVQFQVGILNALSSFGAALGALADNAKDPIASVTLLRTYNMAEQQMFTAFNALALYSAQKATSTTP